MSTMIQLFQQITMLRNKGVTTKIIVIKIIAIFFFFSRLRIEQNAKLNWIELF